MDRYFHMCEDNAGGLYIEEWESTDTETKLLCCIYYSPQDSYYAGQDWCEIVLNDSDPYGDRREGLMSASDLLQYEYAPYAYPKTIASSNWDSPLGFCLERCGNAGKDAGMSAGAFYQCPDCGEISYAVMEPTYHSYACPETCPSCGERMD